MAGEFTKSQARAKVRNRLRDNSSPPAYADSLVDEMGESALRLVYHEVMKVDATFYLTRRTYDAFSDALDPSPDGTAQLGYYEFYPLPEDFGQLAWAERADGGWHPKLTILPPVKQELARFGGGIRGTLDVGGITYSLPLAGAIETVSIFKDRFRVLPPPNAVGAQYGIFYYKRPRVPGGDDEELDIPDDFQEVYALDAAIRILAIDGDPMADSLRLTLFGNPETNDPGELARAKENFGRRPRRDTPPVP